jgi:diguanylate cyclase (GGDEF)-like protein
VRDLLARARALQRIDYARVLELADSAFEIACQADGDGRQDTDGMASSLSVLAHRSCRLGDAVAGLSQANQALGLLDESVSCVVLGELYDTIGWAHFTTGDYAEAFESLIRAQSIAEAVGDRNLQAYVMDSLANLQSSTGHPSDALANQLRAAAIHRELGDLVGEATTLNNMAYSRMELGDFGGALRSAKAARDYAEQAHLHALLVGVLDTLCDVYTGLGDLDAAEKHARAGLDLAVAQGWRADQTNSLIGLARIALAREHPGEARAFAETALGLAEQDRRSVEQYRCHNLIADALEQEGDLRGALTHFRRFHELEHAMRAAETQSRLANLRVEHQLDTARKDAEIHRLRSLALEQEIEERRLAQATLEARASLDPLTGLYNRSHLAFVAGKLQAGLAEFKPVALLLLDVDNFKTMNDTCGHRAGDKILISIARDLAESVREADVTCRYGGDEFLVFLADTSQTDAVATAQRIRRAIESRVHDYLGESVVVTASLGVACTTPPHSATLETLIERADHALYTAKRGGRNRVVVDPATARAIL